LYDGSYGVHNGPYDVELLQAANNWVFGQIITTMTQQVYDQSLLYLP